MSNPVMPTSIVHTYDMSTFDFTAPASWLALGQAWKLANGTEPTQEQLMQCVMSGGQLLAPSQNQTSIPSSMGNNTQWNADEQVPVQQISVYGDGMQHGGMPGRGQHSSRGFRGANRGGVRGRGGFHGRNQWDEGRAADENEFVVGVQSNLTPANDNDPMSDESQSLSGTGMRRVGDRWVFVRDGQVVSWCLY
jgi:protein NRD1